MFYVYILKLNNNRYYKGLSKNIKQRLKQHQSGQVVTTKGHLPFKLVHIEMTTSRKNARKLEKFFKSGFGREIIKEIDS